MNTDIDTSIIAPQTDAVTLRLLQFSLAMFLGFLAIGIPLSVLPGQIHVSLGFSAFVVGCTMGAQSVATLVTRQYAGRLCDRRGPRRAALAGLTGAAATGLLYLVSNACAHQPVLSLTILLVARLVLGFGESLFVTALTVWGMAHVGPQHAGRAMSWSGIAIYGALAIGAPIGGWLAQRWGFVAVSLATAVCPVAAVFLVNFWADVTTPNRKPQSFSAVLRAIWTQGTSMTLASTGFGTIAAFLALLYHAKNWQQPAHAITAFGIAYIATRLVLGGLPDRFGGYRLSVVTLLLEAAGLLLIWRAGSPLISLLGATITGVGYSLVFPSLGVEAMRGVPPERRALTIGAFLACLDLGLAGAGPFAGAIADAYGLPATFIAAAISCCLAALLTLAAGRTNATRAVADHL